MSFFEGPSKLDEGIVDLGGTGNFVAPFPKGVVFFTEAISSFFGGPSKLEVGIVDLDATGNFVGPPPGDAPLAVSPPAILDGSVIDERSPTDSFTLSLLVDGIVLDGIPNFGRSVCFLSVSPDLSSFFPSFMSSEVAISSFFSALSTPSFFSVREALEGGVEIANFFGGDPNGDGALPKGVPFGGGTPKPTFLLEAACFGTDPNGGPDFLGTLLSFEGDLSDNSSVLESLVIFDEFCGSTSSETVDFGEEPNDGTSFSLSSTPSEDSTSEPTFLSDPEVDSSFFVKSLLLGDAIPNPSFLDVKVCFGGTPNGVGTLFPNGFFFDDGGTPKPTFFPGPSCFGGNLNAEGGGLNGVGGVLNGDGGDLKGEVTFFGNALLFDDTTSDASFFPAEFCLGKESKVGGVFFSDVPADFWVGKESNDETAFLPKAVIFDGGTPNSTFWSGLSCFEGELDRESFLSENSLLFEDGNPDSSSLTGLSCFEGAPNGEGGDLNGAAPFFAKALFSDDGTPKPTCLPVTDVFGGDLNGEAAFFSNVLPFEDGTPNPTFFTGVFCLGGPPNGDGAFLPKEGFFEDGTPNPTCLPGGACLVDETDGAASFFESVFIVDVVSITSLVLTFIL